MSSKVENIICSESCSSMPTSSSEIYIVYIYVWNFSPCNLDECLIHRWPAPPPVPNPPIESPGRQLGRRSVGKCGFTSATSSGWNIWDVRDRNRLFVSLEALLSLWKLLDLIGWVMLLLCQKNHINIYIYSIYTFLPTLNLQPSCIRITSRTAWLILIRFRLGFLHQDLEGAGKFYVWSCRCRENPTHQNCISIYTCISIYLLIL